MSVRFEDRKSTYPGRYKATKTDGTSEYITLERADEPTVEGTPLNAVTFNSVLRGHTPRNLLDNSDFRNPVNQRRQTSYTASGYTIDRWMASKAQPVTVNSDGVTLDGTSSSIVLAQRLNPLKDGIYTVVVKVGEHIHVRQYKKEGTTYTRVYTSNDYPGGYAQLLSNSGTPEFQFRANSGSIITAEWAALYEGEYTAETLPEYQPKGYGAELAECYRYYYKGSNNVGLFYPAAYIGTNGIYFVLSLPTQMRVLKPSVSATSMRVVSLPAYAVPDGFTFDFTFDGGNQLRVAATKTAHGLSQCMFEINQIEISADL